MEELGRANMLNASLLLHVLDDAEMTSSSSEVDLPTLFERLRDAARRLAGGAVDIHQTATYHRRWSLLQGAEPAVVRPLLGTGMGTGVKWILDVNSMDQLSSSVTVDPPTHEDDDDISGEVDEGMTSYNNEKGPATPPQLTLSDVESVLGYLSQSLKRPNLRHRCPVL